MGSAAPQAAKVWTVRGVLLWTSERLEAVSSSARLDAEVLLGHALDVDRLQLYLDYDKPLTPSELVAYRELVRRRLRGEPVAYIVGRREFWSLSLAVGPAVLVPRPETELLVELGIARLREHPPLGRLPRVLDVCTGSGAVALAFAHELGGAVQLTASDRSLAALRFAANNARALGLSVALLCADLLEAFVPESYWDLIVANPPYIGTGELAALEPQVRDWEPVMALDGGVDGLDVIRRLVPDAVRRLLPGGCLMLEIAPAQSAAVSQLLAQSGCSRVEVHRDLAGRERVVSGCRD